jgi:two-component system, NtrC family, response regulator HydG
VQNDRQAGAQARDLDLDFHRDPRILNLVIDAMEDGLFTVDAAGRIVAWNGGAERITGYTSDEVVGTTCDFLQGPECSGFDSLDDLLAGEIDSMTISRECKVCASDGRELYLHGHLRTVVSGGRILGAVGTFQDLTGFVRTRERVELLENQVRDHTRLADLIGKSAAMQRVFRSIRLAAQSDVTTLISGPSGTGKELAARAIHAGSERRTQPFLAINCAAIPETLLESELFGHVRGSFTGAIRDKVGLFQSAAGGTLLLDEVGEISPLLQIKLLRVLQEREVRRVGDEVAQKIDVRLLTATNRDFGELLRSGRLREDFYYRVRVFEIAMPALCTRREDIPLLVEQFLAELSPKRQVGITRGAIKRLLEHSWPGNVRELRNAIEHALVVAGGGSITLLDLPPEIRDGAGEPVREPAPVELTPEQLAQRERVLAALAESGGNRTRAAQALGVSRVTLWKRMRRLGIGT